MLELSFQVNSRKCLILGLNPALQRSVKVSELHVGSVNRALSVKIGIGGKGQDVYVAAGMMGLFSSACQVAPVLAQFLGKGSEGDKLYDLLADVSNGKIDGNILSVRSHAPLRICTTLVDGHTNEATEIVEPSGTIEAGELDAMREAIKTHFKEEAVGGVAVMGSMPPGCPPDYYDTLLSQCCDASSKVLLDTATGVVHTINSLNQKGCKVMLKVNARELCQLTGLPVPVGAEAATATSQQSISDAADKLLSMLLPIPPTSSLFVASTDGPYAAFLSQLSPQRRRWCLELPPLPRELCNPIGAGDAVSAGTLMAWDGAFQLSGWGASGVDEVTAFSWGLACGAASCLTDSNSVFTLEDAMNIYSKIKVVELGM